MRVNERVTLIPLIATVCLPEPSRCLPLLHLHGEALRSAPVSALLKALLLRLHLQMVDGEEAPMPSLPVPVKRLRAGQLSVVRGYCGAGGESAADMCQY